MKFWILIALFNMGQKNENLYIEPIPYSTEAQCDYDARQMTDPVAADLVPFVKCQEVTMVLPGIT